MQCVRHCSLRSILPGDTAATVCINTLLQHVLQIVNWNVRTAQEYRGLHDSACAVYSQVCPWGSFGTGSDGSEVIDMLWALANSQHYTPELAEVEQALLRAGGLPNIKTMYHVNTVLWSFATLGYTPKQLLQHWELNELKTNRQGEQQLDTVHTSKDKVVQGECQWWIVHCLNLF